MVARARGCPAAWLTSHVPVCAHPSPRRLQGRAKLSKARWAQPAERSPVPTLTPPSRNTTARFFTHNRSRGRQRRIVEKAPSGASGCSRPCAIPPPHVTGDSARATAGGGRQWPHPVAGDSYDFWECLPATHVATQMCAHVGLTYSQESGSVKGPWLPKRERDGCHPASCWPRGRPGAELPPDLDPRDTARRWHRPLPNSWQVKAIRGGRFQIGNNRGFINGWVRAGAIHGRCIQLET
jgi:hypothetical protein